MSISVVMATYNGARFLDAQLESILSQTLAADEIIVADDGSKDNTEEIIQQWRRRFPQLVYLPPGGAAEDSPLGTLAADHKPLGPAGNFSRALQAARGDLIAFSDQDDIWLPDRLRLQAEVFARHPDTLLVHGDADLVDERGFSLGATLFQTLGVTEAMRRQVNEGGALGVLLRRNIVTGACAMVRRQLVQAALPIPSAWLHDEWLAVAAAGRMRTLAEPVIKYRQHGQNCVGAAALSFKDKVSKLFAPGGERNARLLLRIQQLADRCGEILDRDTCALVQQKLAHEQFRSALSRSRLLRLPRILRHSSDYRRFGNGTPDMLRDLLQPR